MPTGVYKHSEDQVENFKKSMIGKRWKVKDSSKMGRKAGSIPWNKGKKWPEEIRNKFSLARMGRFSGENHPNWKGGKTDRNKHVTTHTIYKNWRLKVFGRDNFKCRINNCDCSGLLQAHHILPWRDFPELRYEVNNGITLCQAHHPRKRAEEKRMIHFFQGLVTVSN